MADSIERKTLLESEGISSTKRDRLDSPQAFQPKPNAADNMPRRRQPWWQFFLISPV